MRKTAVLLLLALCAAPLQAQEAYLVKDINAITSSSANSSYPHNFFRFGSRIFFAATTPATGVELWSTDGTEGGTAQVAEINPSSASSYPSRFVVVNGKLLFNARDSRGEELWTSDGSSSGTKLLADINSGSRYSYPGDRIVINNQLLFAADDGVNGSELWITDGTPAGTRLFKDLLPGSSGSVPHDFVNFKGAVYFAAAVGLWKTDGTEAGTTLVKDSVDASDLAVSGSRLFFSGYTSASGREPWVSDGTESGTRMLADIAPASASSTSGSQMIPFAGGALFVASDFTHGLELWISDGSTAGTHIVRDISPGVSSGTGYTSIIAAGNVAYFAASERATGNELWRTDGTEAGTSLVRDIVPGIESSDPGGFVLLGNQVYFTAGSTKRLLWTTDGTATGTRQVKTTDPRPVIIGLASDPFSTAIPPIVTNIDGTLYFAAANTLNGYELWKSDGTDAGTAMMKNIATDAAPSSYPINLTPAADWIYFEAWDGIAPLIDGVGPRALWRSDGTAEGTVKVSDATSGSYFPAGRSLFFTRDHTLWTTTGTPERTTQATAFTTLFPHEPSIVAIVGDKIFASVDQKLWVTTTALGTAVSLGAPAGTRPVDIAGRAMFMVGSSVWSTDGTPAGTFAVVNDLGESPTNFGIAAPAVAGGLYYFITNSSSGVKLWKSDGTFQGTTAVRTFSQTIPKFMPAARNLFFVVGTQLWVTDGTDAGTHSLPATTTGAYFAAIGDRILFSATDAATGVELWQSDGTDAGTKVVRDIFPGTASGNPSELTAMGNLIYFGADDGLHGREIWVTDGTTDGTKLAADVEPGAFGSQPGYLVSAGQRLFFNATTIATGSELWALQAPSTPALTINDTRVAEGNSGTTTARFSVTLSAAAAQTVTVDYATSDGSATSGTDYDAVTGTLTFAPGETSKTIDVRVRGDAADERNETFFLTLRTASGAVLSKTTGFAIIEDDDALTADLALDLDFSQLIGGSVFINVTNNGPLTATNATGRFAATPGGTTPCVVCLNIPAQMAPGAKSHIYEARDVRQRIITATVTAHERDPQPANNSVAFMANGSIAMDAAYLTPGSQATVWFSTIMTPVAISIESSNPAVISVPSSIAPPGTTKPVSFVARGISSGKATIRVFNGTVTIGTLDVDVVAPGTTPRWPGGLEASVVSSFERIDLPITVRINHSSTVPFTGETATGTITISTNGTELARVTPVGPGFFDVPIYLPDLGTYPLKIDYAGDANFLPATLDTSVMVTRGVVTLLASAERSGSTVTVHVRATGSPIVAPTGTISVAEPGVIASKQASLTPSTRGGSEATITLTGVSAGQHTLVITYSGDARYNTTTQNARVIDVKRRTSAH